MKTQRDITTALHAGDWAVHIDLTDAYFHVPIHLKSRHLLRFALQMEDRVRVFSVPSSAIRPNIGTPGFLPG